MVQYKEGTAKSVTGHDLFTVEYYPDSTPRAAVCFHHGIQEHIGRYSEAFTLLADSGIAVYSGDAVGHGKSGGDRIYVPSFATLVDDFQARCTAAREDLQQRCGGTPPPMFIAGHSMGGLVAPLTCLKDQSRWAGLLLCSPALDVEWTPMLRVQAAVGGLLAAVVPRARLTPAVDTCFLNKDPAKVREYVEDALVTLGNLPIRTANESLRAFRQLATRHAEFTLPVYAHHGVLDKVTVPAATRAFIAGIASGDKTMVEVAGGFHEVFNEAGGVELVKGMADWMLAHAGGAPAKM